MLELRRSAERGHANHGWLDSYFSFSFAEYYDANHMGFATLRVINEDRVQPGRGFATHGHRDMEIITYILTGVLEHKDSMGNGSLIRPGDVQRMSAGTGVRHSEFNPSSTESVHLLQIWIEPAVTAVAPGYEQRHFPEEQKRGRLRLIASDDAREESVRIHQDAAVYAGLFDGAETATHLLQAGRRAYLHVARGTVTVNERPLTAGDAAKITDEATITIKNGDKAEVLLFDLT